MELTAEQLDQIKDLPSGVHDGVVADGVVVKLDEKAQALSLQDVAQLLNGDSVPGLSEDIASHVRTHVHPPRIEPSLRHTKDGFEVIHNTHVLERSSLDELIMRAEHPRAVVAEGRVHTYDPRRVLQAWNEGDIQDLTIRRACTRAGISYLSLFPEKRTAFGHVHEWVNRTVRRQPHMTVLVAGLLALTLGVFAWNVVGSTPRPPDVPVGEQIRRQLAVIDNAERREALTLDVVAPRITAYDNMDVNVRRLDPDDRTNYERLRAIVEEWRPRYEEAME